MAKKTYHHGNLREAIIAAATTLLEEGGVEGLSLRKVAAQTGVSPTALYSHFRDKRELLAVLATTGFELLTQNMLQEAGRPGAGSEGDAPQLTALARGYVLFAIDNSALFQLMFGREIGDLLAFPQLVAAGSRCYSLMADSVASAMQDSADTQTASIGATAAWSTVHGLAMLILDGRIKAADFDASDNGELVEQVCGMLRFSN